MENIYLRNRLDTGSDDCVENSTWNLHENSEDILENHLAHIERNGETIYSDESYDSHQERNEIITCNPTMNASEGPNKPKNSNSNHDKIFQISKFIAEASKNNTEALSSDDCVGGKEPKKSPKPRAKTKCAVKRQMQRKAANVRERSRMKTINEAFRELKNRIPLVCKDRKVSKADTLRLAIRYIYHLLNIMDNSGSSAADSVLEKTQHFAMQFGADVSVSGMGISSHSCLEFPWRSIQSPKSTNTDSTFDSNLSLLGVAQPNSSTYRPPFFQGYDDSTNAGIAFW